MKRTLPTFLSALGSRIIPFKNLSYLLAVLLFSGGAWGQVTITNPSNTTPTMSATYTSLALAIADVNNRTAISGPVTITLDASTPQTAPAGGYSITNTIITGGSVINRFVFDGGGNTITAGIGTSTTTDAFFKIIGADFVTLQNFVMVESFANTTATQQVEWGVALLYASTTNGAQNNIIQNNSITLNRANLNTFGVYSNTRHSATAVTTAAEVTSAAGSNSNNKVYTNTISNVNYGIVFIGAGTTIAAIDSGNDIGGSSLSTGNTITNWGGGASTGGYLSLTGSNYCIYMNQQINDNVSYNTITSASLTQSNTCGGILKAYTIGQPTGTITTTINNNTVTVTNNSTAATSGGVIGINSQGLTPLLATATMSMNNNTVQNCVLGGSVSTNNGLTGITNLSLPGTLNMTGNSILNNSITATAATTGSFIGISNSAAAGTVNLNSNIIRGYLNNTSATYGAGSFIGISNSGSVVTALNINSNQIGNSSGNAFTYNFASASAINNGIQNTAGASTCALSINSNTFQGFTMVSASSVSAIINTSGFVGGNISINNNNIGTSTGGFLTFSAATSSAVNGISNAGGSATSVLSIQTNDIRGITYTIAGSSAHNYIANTFATLSQNISSNTFTNLNVNTTGSVTFISNNVALPTGGSLIASSNSIVTGFNKAGAGGTVTLYLTSNTPSSVTTTTKTEQNNNFSNITLTGATTMAGWMDIEGVAAGLTKTITGNTFSNWSCGSGNVNVLQVGYCLGSSSISSNTISTITGTGTITGISLLINNVVIAGVTSNSITGLSSTGTGGSVTGISNSGGTASINSNTINNLSSTSTTATVAGITTSVTANIFQNTINTLSCVGTTSGVTNGIMVTGGTSVNVYRNKIYDLATTGAFTTVPGVNGIVLSAGTTVNTYNNLIGDLKATSANSTDAIRGISITSTTSSTSQNVYNNTIYLTGGSAGANFGTSGIYHTASATATTAALDLQNNMIFNTCTPNGTGIVTAYRKSAAATLGNYKTTSNKNLFYAGTPSTTTTIMSDGTNNYQTLATFQTAVSTREANSFTELTFDPATYFVSTTSSNANYLQPISGLNTQAEGGGNTITMCSPDYNGVTRPGFSGAAYDVGAWEFAGVSPAPVLTNMTPSPALTTQCTKAARSISIDITTASGTITGATLNYNHNGTAQTAVTMTNSSGTTWTGTMLAPSTGNATVTWSITATNSLGLNTLYSGTSYADEPTTGITATATATPSTVCDGSNASLSVSVASTGTTTIGTGTFQPSSIAGYSAFNGYYSSQWSQTIFTGAELSASGLVAGPISSIAYNISTQGSSTSNNITIKIGTTSSSTVGTTFVPTSSFTTVYGPTSYTHTSSGWQTIIFANNFIWDGVSNIILDVWQDGPNSSANPLTYCTGLADNKVLYYYNTSTAGATGTPTVYRMNTKFGGLIAQTPSAYSWSNGTTTLGTTNPLSTPITSGLTYTATATVNGCPMTAAVTPTVNPLPTAPTGTPSSQCGAGIPTASVADNNSYTTPTFKWYSATSGGTALQSSTSTTYTTSISANTTFYVAVVGANGCESARTAVTVTVSQPDAISANTSATAICLGQSVTLTAANTASMPTQNYTYSWICATTGSGATSANTNNPASITPTAAGSYTYTVTATDGACSAVNTVAVTVNALPNITSATATPSAVCSGAAITLTGASVPASAGIAIIGNGSTQGSNASTFVRVGNTVGNQFKNQYLFTAAELNAAGLTTGNITSLNFDVFVSGGGTVSNLTFKLGTTSLTNLTSSYVSGLTQVYTAGTYPATGALQVGLQTVTFDAPFLWDGTSNLVLEACSQLATSGTAGDLRSNTTTFVSTITNSPSTTACGSSTGLGTVSVRPNFRFGGQIGTNQTSLYSWSWNSTPSIATASGSTIETNTGASATTRTYTVTATNATTGCVNTATTSAVTINPAPVAPTATNSTQCGTLTPTCSVTGTGTLGNTFKWYLASTGGTALVGQIGSTLSSYPVAATTSFYVSETNGTCESARVQVDVTVTAAPTITAAATLSTVCSGSPTVLSVTSANSGYTYAWDNSAGTGASVSVSPTSNTTYTVTATDSSGGANNGCSTTATLAITTNALPSAITLTPSSTTNLCLGDVKTIVASGGNIVSQGTVTLGTGTTTLSTTANYAAFNGYRASAWIQTIYTASELSAIGLAAGNITSIAYNINSQGSSTSNNITIKIGTISASNFATTTLLSTSAFTTVYGPTAYTHSASGWQTINFATPYNWDGVSNIVVDVWQDGPDSSFDPATYFSTTSDNKVNYTWNVTPSATPPTGNSTTSRFNVKFTGNVNTPQTISWSPTATLYTDAAATNAYTGNPTTVYAKPTTNTTYTATATSSNGCTSTNSVAISIITDKTWLGTTNTSWNNASNWSCGTMPNATDVIVISSGSPVLDTNFTVGASGSLILSGSGTLTISPTSTLTVTGTANFGGKAVTIKSNATGNGAIGQVTGTLTGATNVTVERYLPAKRSWRAITAPVTMTTSINANWQEGGTGNSTNGFDIWDSNGGTGIITGGSGSSLLEYSSSANTWTGITNTSASSSMLSGSVNKPFMAFVTGPYGSNNVTTGAAVTTLRATGTLLTGDKTYATTANKYAFIGNPYASPLDLTAMLNNTSNATGSFGGNVWVWDANVLGTYSVGTYNLFDFAASNYSNTSNNANISGAQIQSGQAFFVKSTDGTSFSIKEAHKGSVFTNAVFRSGAPEILRANLYKQVNNEWAGRDGAMTVLLSDAAANQSANKLANSTENIAFTKNGASFASNHHLPLVASDVLNVKVWNTTAGANYKLKINTEAFTATNLSATLEDLFTNSRTPLNLEGAAVEYPFTVTTDALSSGDRFRIVFQNIVLGTNNPTANGFQIVPNPVTGDSFQVNLGTLATGTYSYSICNAIGQEVEKGTLNNATHNTNYEMKMSTAATGIYVMKIKGSDNSVFTAKIIKK